MRRLRVCQMITSLRVGGAERVVVDLATRMDSARFAVEVATARGGGGFAPVLAQAGIPFTLFDVAGNRAPLEFARMVRFLRGRFDIVHAHPGTVARLAAVAAGVPVIVSTLHNIYDWKSTFWSGSERLLNLRTERIVAVSEAVRDSALGFYRLPAARVETIYNGIDTGAFSPPTHDERQQARRHLGLDGARRWVVAACHLADHKRPDLLVRALGLLRSKGLDAGLVVAGDGPMRPELERLARALGVSDALRLIGVTDVMATLYRAADVFAHAAVREGLGLAVIEAMSTGLPVVAARAAALENFLDHERNALLAPLDDADGLAEGLYRVLTEPTLAATLGDAARRTAVERFAVERMVRDYERLYEEAL